MAETFNPIISHLYSGQGGVSREITKYNNAIISEINVVDNGVTTKYDFGKLSTIPVTGSVLKNTIKQPLDSIKFYGNTMRWCQLCVDPTFATPSMWDIPASMTLANNKITMQGMPGSSVAFSMNRPSGNKFNGINGHIYLFSAIVTSSAQTTSSQFRVFTGSEWGYPSAPTIPAGTSRVLVKWTYNKTSSASCSLNFYSNLSGVSGGLPEGETMTMENLMVFDLTYIFGAGNEPSTEAEFIRRLKKIVYPYSPGEILSIEQASAYLYGLNIWDEEWEVGSIDGSTGENDNSVASLIRSKNYTIVTSGETYYASIAEKNTRIFYYDGNKAFLSYYDRTGDGTFTVPNGAVYIRFRMNTDYGTTYNHDICISLSNASTNGTYEASKGEQSMRLLSTNIYDRRLDTTGYALTSIGNIESNYKRVVSDYIDVSGASYVSMNYGASYAFYNESKVYISGDTKSYSVFRSYAIPSGAKYIRVDNVLDTISGQGVMMVLGQYTSETLPSYVPYGYGYATLNGVGDAVDTVTIEKETTEPFGLVDLGDLVWYRDTTQSYPFFYTLSLNGLIRSITTQQPIATGAYNRQSSDASLPDWVFANLPDKTIGYHWNGSEAGSRYIYIKDLYYTDPTAFKSSLKGKYMYFQLDGVTYSSNDPFLSGSYVKNISTIDMGSLNWGYNSERGAFYATISDAIDYSMNVLCSKYTTVQMSVIWNGTQDKVCSMQNNYIGPGYNKRIVVRDTDYTDASAFKTAMSGVILCYELSAPVETALTEQECAQILNGAFTKSKYSTLLIDNDNGQIDQTVDIGMWEQR